MRAVEQVDEHDHGNKFHSNQSDSKMAKDDAMDKEGLMAKFGQGFRHSLEMLHKAKAQQERKVLEEARKEAAKGLSEKEAYGNVIKPKYKYDERLKVQVESDAPPDCLFMEVGHDKTAGSGEKHYRRYYPVELEKIVDEDGVPDKDGVLPMLFQSPFLSETITRMNTGKASGLLAGLFGGGAAPEAAVQSVGEFKGFVRCYVPELAANRRKEMEKCVSEISSLVVPVYESATEKTFPEKYNFSKFVENYSE